MGSNFAIITFRASGPIKTWSDMRGANVHNARTKPIEHAIEGAPAPEFLIGTNDLVADVRKHLRLARIDPDRLRKNGVIAYEAIMTASPAFFEEGDAAFRADRLAAWTAAQRAFALKRWGAHRVASMVLHLDEKTPHIHLVVIPMEAITDGRRKNRDEVRFSLVGRSISGPGRFDQLQDEYAAAMQPFGLVRGVAGSGRKNEPMAQFIARTERSRQAAELERADLVARQRQADADLAALADLRRAAVAEQDAARADRAAIVSQAQQVARESAAIERERVELAEARQQLDQVRAALDEERDRLLGIAQRAAAFMDRIARVSARDLQPSVQAALIAANSLRSGMAPMMTSDPHRSR